MIQQQQQQGGMPSREELMAMQQQQAQQPQQDQGAGEYQQNAGLQERQANTIEAIKQQAYQQGIEVAKQQFVPQLQQMQAKLAQQEQAHSEQINAIGQDRETQLDAAHKAGTEGRIPDHQKEAMLQSLQSKVQSGEIAPEEAQAYAQQLMNA